MRATTKIKDSTLTALKVAVLVCASYSAGIDIDTLAAGRPDIVGDGWLPLLNAVKSAPQLAVCVDIVALTYLFHDLAGGARRSRDAFGSPITRAAAIAAVSTGVGLQIAAAVALVGPIYLPLFTTGTTAFLNGLPHDDAGWNALLGSSSGTFNLRALTVIAAWRYVRRDLRRQTLPSSVAAVAREIGGIAGGLRRQGDAHAAASV